ncbi:hypothetical protein CI791_07620 [Leuconostoc lactis]|uniref:hypothetical protein n=1 Tax=Leuconostoc lactis TaxID=1246 RepID=UPI000BABE9DD|nr:hypothetical protein [Leuconostoc lactis]PAV33115.1 hypothetical protein CI791_07620 [Leuconostoc lactis]
MNEKTGIYFYKNIFGQNKYIATTSSNSVWGVDMKFSDAKDRLKKRVPKLNLGTYLLIDGTVFKL